MRKLFIILISVAIGLFMTASVYAEEDSIWVESETPPATVKNVKVLKNGYRSLKVIWEPVEGADYYQVYRSTTGKNGSFILKRETKATTYTNIGVSCGRMYYYKVRAVNTKGRGFYSKVKSNRAQPSAVKILKVEPMRDMETCVKWNKVRGASGYEIYRKRTEDSTWQKYKTVSVKTTTLTENYSNDELNFDWEYKIRAYRKINGRKVFGYFSEVKKWIPDWTIEEICADCRIFAESLRFPVHEWNGEHLTVKADGSTYNWHFIENFGTPNTCNWDVLWPKVINRYMTKESIMESLKGKIECDLNSTAEVNPLYWEEEGGYDIYYGRQEWHASPGWNELKNFGIYCEPFGKGYKIWLLW